MKNKNFFPEILKIAAVYKGHKIKPHFYTIEGNETKYIGDIRLISALSKVLGFKYDILIAADGQYGSPLENGNWTGMVGMLVRGEADVAISKLSISKERLTAVDFSYPYKIEPVVFITDKPKYFSDTWAVLHPFSPNVWYTLITTFLFIQLLWYVLELRRNSMSTIFVKTLSSFFEKSINVKYYRRSTKIMLWSWIVGAMFMTYSYKAVLLSFLTLPSLTGIRDVKQLSKASEKSFFQCSTYSKVYADLLNSGPETWKIISNCITRTNLLTNDVLSFLIPSTYQRAFIGSKSHLNAFYKYLFISDDVFFIDLMSIAVRKSFCCKDALDKAINKLAAVGLLDKFDKDETFFHSLVTGGFGNDPNNSAKKLLLEDFSGPFIILALGLILASTVLVVEILSARKNIKKSS